MAGPGGMHLSMESTIKSVFESYSCGKDAFGFDRDFIIEVVNSCPSSSCRYFKGQQSVPSFEQPSPHQSFPNQSQMDYIQPTRQSPMMQPPTHDISKLNRTLSNQHQQMMQNRVMSQSMENLEKQRVMQQLDKKHYETVAAIVQANNNLGLPNQPMVPAANMMPQAHQHSKTMDYSRFDLNRIRNFTILIRFPPRRPSYDGIETYSAASYATSNKELLHNNWATSSVPPVNFDRDVVAGQEKIVRAFAELMKNMARMKAFIRPSMVKPYGKQSENLQKSLMDSIQLVQTLRNFLPKPHISINNWKNVEAEVSIQ